MKNLKLLIITFISITTVGCNISTVESRIEANKRAEKRLEVFETCMNLAAKVNKATEQHYNDLSEVVERCSYEGFRMTNGLRFK